MTYRAPLRSLTLALHAAGHRDLLGAAFPDLDSDTVAALLESASAFAENELAPLNRVGDQIGARYENGKVTAAQGFVDAYRAFAAQGWNGIAAPTEYGGQGLGKTLELAVFEMFTSANMAFVLCPMLGHGAVEALIRHGSARQKTMVLPRLVSGEWTGTMNLTEPQAGSDLASVATRATPDGQGGYLLTGQKIFITWGDHDATENICHLVLARTPDAPPGAKGVSLFLATKRLVNDDGSLGAMNDLRPAGIEHKLGIHGSPTCVMVFENARAELVGEVNKGIAQMFVMMNAARLHVGVQGVAIAERALQQAFAFAQERKQGATAWGGDGIYGHPDVRRMLTLMRAKTEAARALCLTTGVLTDISHHAATEGARTAAAARQELLTPIAKAWCTDVGVEVASLGVQVHGGMGYIEETGAAQYYRDARIAPIYEGTNGIQAIDLVGRKLAMQDGAVMRDLCADMKTTAREVSAIPALAGVGAHLQSGVDALEATTTWIKENRGPKALAGATRYLQLAGDVIGGWLLAKQAAIVADAPDEWAASRLALTRYYASQVLSAAPGFAKGVVEGADDLEHLNADALRG